jgi:hypothetical protein
MRRVSKKRRKLLAEVGPIREQLRLELGARGCERCGKTQGVLHEISRGPDRSRSLTIRGCLLFLCDPGCHQTVGAWPRAKQLALVLLRRPAHFDLPNYWAIIHRRTPDLEEVLAWVPILKQELGI